MPLTGRKKLVLYDIDEQIYNILLDPKPDRYEGNEDAVRAAKDALSTPPRQKWPPYRRRYFQMHCREWKVLWFDQNFT